MSFSIIKSTLDYIHNNPVEAGFLEEAHRWKYTSAKNYAGEVGQVSVEIL